MLHIPFYDPEKTYEENFEQGPFGAFADPRYAEGSGEASGKILRAPLDNDEPKYEFLGMKVFSPFGIANGLLINGKFVKGALDKGFDIVEYKDTRSHQHPCNPMPNLVPLKMEGNVTLEKAQKGIVVDDSYKEPLFITNSFGIPSMDPSFWQEDLRDAVLYAKPGQVVIGGIQGTIQKEGGFVAYLEDFRLVARLVKETGVKIVELNLSCPNEGTANLLCFDVERSVKVVEAVKKEIGNTPLIIKISYFPDIEHLNELVQAAAPFVEAISAINTIPAKIIDSEGKPALTAGRISSGTCGAPVKWAGLDMVKKLKKLQKELGLHFEIVGVGGVMKPEDFFEYREAGADLVMSATGAMWNPYLAQEIKSRLQ